jgi:hypothetical protein
MLFARRLTGRRITSVALGTIRITATGKHNASAKGNEVIIVEARTSSGLIVDLARLAGAGVEIMHDVVIDGSPPALIGLKLLPGATLELPLGQKGTIHMLCHPWSGEANLETGAKVISMDLFSVRHELRRMDMAHLLPQIAPRGTVVATNDHATTDHVRHEARRQLAALGPFRSEGDVLGNTLAIYTPRWKGVTAATRNLFRCTLGIPLTPEEHPDDIGDGYVTAVSEAILESGFRNVIFSGGDAVLFSLAGHLKKRQPHLSIRQVWHGSYLQMGETHEWRLFRPWLDAARSGLVDSIAVVKPGLDTFLRSLGVRSYYIQNISPFDRARVTRSKAINVAGLWLSGSSEYRKMPYASLLALAGLPRFSLRASGLGELGFRMVDELGIHTAARFFEPIPHAQVLQEIRQTTLTLYITLSECMPMVPIESISCGVPCIVGPATRLYDDQYLNDHLLVNDPTDPYAIRSKIEGTLADYPEVFDRSVEFLDRLSTASRRYLSSFLADDLLSGSSIMTVGYTDVLVRS